MEASSPLKMLSFISFIELYDHTHGWLYCGPWLHNNHKLQLIPVPWNQCLLCNDHHGRGSASMRYCTYRFLLNGYWTEMKKCSKWIINFKSVTMVVIDSELSSPGPRTSQGNTWTSKYLLLLNNECYITVTVDHSMIPKEDAVSDFFDLNLRKF